MNITMVMNTVTIMSIVMARPIIITIMVRARPTPTRRV
jgi:hypothetical protein